MKGIPCGSAGKESSCNAGDLSSIPGFWRSPREGKGYLYQIQPGKFNGLHNPWDHKELDMTEQLSLHIFNESGGRVDVCIYIYTHMNTHIYIHTHISFYT